jgi:outer membrane protein assembly factor BamB
MRLQFDSSLSMQHDMVRSERFTPALHGVWRVSSSARRQAMRATSVPPASFTAHVRPRSFGHSNSALAVRSAAKCCSVTFLVIALIGCSDGVAVLVQQPKNNSRIAWTSPEIRSPLASSALAADTAFVFAYTSSHSIAAARLTNGSVAWRADADETFDGDASPMGLALCSDRVVFGSHLALYGVTPSTGARRWRWRPSLGGGFYTSYPVCADSSVYVGTAGSGVMRLYAVDARTGRERWWVDAGSKPGANGFVGTPATTNGVVIGCTREFTQPKTGMIFAVDAETGRERWRFRWQPEPTSNLDASCARFVAAADGRVVAAADDGRIFCFDAATGALRWTAPATGIVRVVMRDERPIVIANGVAVVGSLTGVIVGIDVASGQERWKNPADLYSIVYDGWTSDGDQVLGVTSGGWAIALDARTGIRQWTVKAGGELNVQLFFDTGVLTRDLFIAVSPDALYALRRF